MAQHPTDMRKPEAQLGTVGVMLRLVDEAMMHAVTGRPNEAAVLQRHGAE
jgi:hypothetical protein